MRSTIRGETGAPALMMRRSEGNRIFSLSQWSESGSSSPGDANIVVTPWSRIAIAIFRGSARAGREGSMSGTTVVIPRAGSKSAKSGKVGRSISPGSMPKVFRTISTWAAKLPWV